MIGQSTDGSGGAAPRERREHFAELEAYRGIAALLVVVFHAYQYSREGTGTPREVYAGTPLHLLFHNLEAPVAWFFALSGFLLFLPFARAAINRDACPSPRGFLVRRAIRVLPPYYLAFLLVWAWRFPGGSAQWRDLLLHLTFTQVFDRAHIFWTIGPAWSLAVEVQFYVLIAAVGPAAYAACGWLATRWARLTLLTGGTTALLLASVGYKWWAGAIALVPQEDFPVYFGPLAKLDTCALGMLLAILLVAAEGRPGIGRGWALTLRLGGAALLAGAFLLRDGSPVVGRYFHTLAGIAFVLVLASTVLAGYRSTLGRCLAHPLLRSLGLISYSVYLWHEPILLELGRRGLLIRTIPEAFPSNAAVLVALSVVVAALGYWGIERPIGELRQLFARDGRLIARYPTGGPVVETK